MTKPVKEDTVAETATSATRRTRKMTDGIISKRSATERLIIAKTLLESVLQEMPSAQPERKTGRWILHENQRQEDVDNGNYLYICSECGKSDIHAKTQEVPFCWWCGSKMEVEHDG